MNPTARALSLAASMLAPTDPIAGALRDRSERPADYCPVCGETLSRDPDLRDAGHRSERPTGRVSVSCACGYERVEGERR